MTGSQPIRWSAGSTGGWTPVRRDQGVRRSDAGDGTPAAVAAVAIAAGQGRSAIFAGGLMRAASMLAAGEIDEPDFNGHWLNHISSMQEMLVADGALVLKFFLHTPRKQRKAPARGEGPRSGWFIDQRDWAALDELDPVLPIAERILRETSGPGAPWTIVESTDDGYRDLTVARTILAALTARLEQKPTTGPSLASSVFGDVETQATVLQPGGPRPEPRQTDVPSAVGQRGKRSCTKLSLEARRRGVSTVLAFRRLGRRWQRGGVIRRVTGALEAGDYRVIPVAAPTEGRRTVPTTCGASGACSRLPAGSRSSTARYGRVLVERIEGFAQPAGNGSGPDEISDFEAQLVERGYYVAKFWLHISREEQLARFRP